MNFPGEPRSRCSTVSQFISWIQQHRSVFIFGHPGHELRIHGWLEIARPTALLLTDGSGTSGRSRLASSTTLFQRAGAEPGPLYGRFTDARIYEAIVAKDVLLFLRLADEIAAFLIAAGAECVIGDAAEGYNPTHDICRLVIDAAVAIAAQIRGTAIANFAFDLVANPDAGEPLGAGALCLELDAQALDRKLQAAHAYVEMAGEVAAALSQWGADAFRKECLVAVDADQLFKPATVAPFYEKYGEQRVHSGAYRQVIRFDDHVRPLAAALYGHVTSVRSVALS